MRQFAVQLAGVRAGAIRVEGVRASVLVAGRAALADSIRAGQYETTGWSTGSRISLNSACLAISAAGFLGVLIFLLAVPETLNRQAAGRPGDTDVD